MKMYGLTSQFRRAAVSIPANIAGDFKKKINPDEAKYMDITQGSAEGCRYYLILGKDLGYCDALQLIPQLEEFSPTTPGLEAYTSSILAPGFCLLSSC